MKYKTYAEYRKAWHQADKIDPPVPLNVDIELASTCNLRCNFCFIPDPKFEEFISQKSDDGKPIRRLMPKEMAFRLIDECAEIGVPALKFNWRGESTLHPDYSEIIRYARWIRHDGKFNDYNVQGNFWEILANTNANCSDKSIDGLMATTKCMISLDSMDPVIYPQMRVGGKLERAKEVIWELVKRGHPNIWVRRVLTKLNYQEPFFESVKKEWGDKVHVSQHYCFDRNAKSRHELSGCDHDGDMPRRYCQYPSQRLIVTSRGLVYPCCLDLHETLPVGDTNKESILEIWNGKPITELRKNLRSNVRENMHTTCQNCESWLAYDMPQRNFVKDIEILDEKDSIIKTP